MSFPPSAACKFLDLPPVNLRNLHLHLTKNPFASRPPHLCGVTLNKTDSQDLKLQDGDKINAKIIIDGGTLAIKIQKDDEEPIYESDGILASNEFEVEVEESGIYTITVTGKKAKGSVNFTVVSVE